MSNNPSIKNDYVGKTICKDCIHKEDCGHLDVVSCSEYYRELEGCPVCKGKIENNDPCSACGG